MRIHDRSTALFLAAGLLFVAAPAPASDAEQYATEMQIIRGRPGNLDEQDRALLQAQADYHRAQVRAAEGVPDSAPQDVRDFAHRLAIDDRRGYDKLETIAAMHGIELGPIDESGHKTAGDSGEPSSADASGAAAETGSGEGNNGAEAFLSARIDAERRALERLRARQDTAAEPNLAGYVKATIPVVAAHLRSARRLAGKIGTSAGAGPVERGAYLARAGDCMSCHTRDGGQPYAGGRPLRTPYGGTIYTSNITPSQAGIGGFDDDDFMKAMHQGIAPDGQPYYPAFPYPSYTKVRDEDVRAIKAYLDTLEPSDYVPPENDLTWPLGIRDVLWAWRELYFEPGRFKPDPDKSDHWNRGAYLVQGLGHCGGCHTPRNVAGAKIEEKALSGAVRRGWYAPNLTPASDEGVGGLTKNELVTMLKTGEGRRPDAQVQDRTAKEGADDGAPDAGGLPAGQQAASSAGAESGGGQVTTAGDGGKVEVPKLKNLAELSDLTDGRKDRGPGPVAATLGPMAEVVHNSLSYLTDDDLDAIVTYLKDLPPQPSMARSDKPSTAGLSPRLYHAGKTLYQGWCAACHRPHGQGEGPYVPALAEDPVLDEAKPNNLVMSILAGAPAEASQAFSPYVRMPAFAKDLSDSDVAALASYLRARWGNTSAPRVPVSLVAELRKKAAGGP